jgi:predicted amidohydrolase YtcJ
VEPPFLHPTPRLAFINANIVTLNPHRPRARWIVINDERITFIGEQDDLNKNLLSNTKVIDCNGKTIIPGFIDAHLHIRALAESLVTLDLKPSKGFRSIVDIKTAVKDLSLKMSAGDWIRGRGYNEFHLTEKRHPTRWDLDEVAPDNPVKLTHRSGHAHVLNSPALNLVGISEQTGDPPGGLIDRDINSGKPTGLLYEMGVLLSERIPSLDHRDLLRGVALANQELLSMGITSVQDASHLNDHERLKEIHSWKEEDLFKPRINLMLNPRGLAQLGTQDLPSCIGENQIRLNGIKLILDETTGQLHPSQEELNNTVLKVHRSGFQVAIHAVEESAVKSACSAIEYAVRRFPRPGHRHRIEHCSVCPPPHLKRLASLGIVVVTQPAFIFYNGDRYLETVPDHQLQHLYPIGSLLKAEIPVAGSSDCPIVPPNPLIGIYSAISRKTETGKIVGEAEKIDPLHALRMYTVHAARASFEEGLKGSISPAKLADLVVLNEDPTTAPPDEIKDIEVEMTIVNGEVVWEKQH